MELTKAIYERRSVRSYKSDVIDQSVVKELIEAAMMAPSWKNSETARFYVVMSPEALERVKSECLPSFNAKRVKEVPVIIVTTFVKGISGFNDDGTACNACGDGWGYYDLGLNNENLLLAAYDKGLDSLIMGLRHEDALRSILNIPESEAVVAVIGFGYRDKEAAAPARKTVEEVAKFF